MHPVQDKVKAAVKPDSEKSTTEHMGDKVKGKSDNAASNVQPEVCPSLCLIIEVANNSLFQQSEKSTTQKVGDKLSPQKDVSFNPACVHFALHSR